MAQALSDDLRLRVLKASAAGMSARQAAARLGVGISTAIRWIARAKQGEPTSRPQGWRRPSALDAHEAFVVDLIEDRKDVTLDEMVEHLSIERQVKISRSALGAWLRTRGWTFKKSPHMHWCKSGRMS
nr:transposase of insertion sequence ISRm10-1, orfA protein [Rhizobium sp. Q54]